MRKIMLFIVIVWLLFLVNVFAFRWFIINVSPFEQALEHTRTPILEILALLFIVFVVSYNKETKGEKS